MKKSITLLAALLTLSLFTSIASAGNSHDHRSKDFAYADKDHHADYQQYQKSRHKPYKYKKHHGHHHYRRHEMRGHHDHKRFYSYNNYKPRHYRNHDDGVIIFRIPIKF